MHDLGNIRPRCEVFPLETLAYADVRIIAMIVKKGMSGKRRGGGLKRCKSVGILFRRSRCPVHKF